MRQAKDRRFVPYSTLKLINIYMYIYLHICAISVLYLCEIDNNKGGKNGSYLQRVLDYQKRS